MSSSRISDGTSSGPTATRADESVTRQRKVRYQLFLPAELSAQFEQAAAGPGASKSSILAAALAAFLAKGDANGLERQFSNRLRTILKQLDRIERNGHVGIESLALFIRYMLTVTAPVAAEDDTARAIGRDRFQAFIVRVGRQLASRRRTFETEGSE